jgi:PIN domain nuclease of toxin-antitoxin system
LNAYLYDPYSHLLWAFTRPRKLGEDACRAFEEIANGESSLLIPVIVLAKLIFTIENKPVQADLDDVLAAIQNSPNVEFVDFDYESAMRLRDLEGIPEMHDRMIVATAIEHQATLITIDESITTSGLVNVIW